MAARSALVMAPGLYRNAATVFLWCRGPCILGVGERYPEPLPPGTAKKATKKRRGAKDEERQGQQSLVVMWERGRLRTQAEAEGTIFFVVSSSLFDI